MLRTSQMIIVGASLCAALSGCKNAYHDQIRQAIHDTHRPELKQCADELRTRTPGASGDVTLVVEVQPNGQVQRAAFGKGDGIKDEAFRGCVRQKAVGWTMPPPQSGQIELVEYRFKI